MKLIALSVARPRLVLSGGRRVSTGIFKEPVAGRVQLRKLNLDGDRQADLSVHGGITKAVYSYGVEHYDYWRSEFPEMRLPHGMFGENFTTEGLSETGVNIGDQFQIGTAQVMITEPRLPCYKLGIKFGRTDIIKRFLASGRSGFYFSVLKEGEVGAGDDIELIHRDDNNVTVADIVRIYFHERDDLKTLRRAVAVKALPEPWRERFQEQLGKLGGQRP